MKRFKQNDLAGSTSELGFLDVVNSNAEELGTEKLYLSRQVELEDGTVITLEGAVPETVRRVLNSQTALFETSVNDLDPTEITYNLPGETYVNNGTVAYGIAQTYNNNTAPMVGEILVTPTLYTQSYYKQYDLSFGMPDKLAEEVYNSAINPFANYIYQKSSSYGAPGKMNINLINLNYTASTSGIRTSEDTLVGYSNSVVGPTGESLIDIIVDIKGVSTGVIYINDFIVEKIKENCIQNPSVSNRIFENYTGKGWYTYNIPSLSVGKLVKNVSKDITGILFKNVIFKSQAPFKITNGDTGLYKDLFDIVAESDVLNSTYTYRFTYNKSPELFAEKYVNAVLDSSIVIPMFNPTYSTTYILPSIWIGGIISNHLPGIKISGDVSGVNYLSYLNPDLIFKALDKYPDKRAAFLGPVSNISDDELSTIKPGWYSIDSNGNYSPFDISTISIEITGDQNFHYVENLSSYNTLSPTYSPGVLKEMEDFEDLFSKVKRIS